MKKNLVSVLLLTFFTVSFFTTKATFAALPGEGTGTTPTAQVTSPKDWLSTINPGFGPSASLGLGFFTDNVATFVISAALFILFTASLIFLLVGGVMWITSGGNKEGMEKAKNTVTYAIIGLALGLGSFIILAILGNFFGINLTGSSGAIPFCSPQNHLAGNC